MEYLDDGRPALRVKSNIQGDITITGDVTIPGTVTVESSHDNPVHCHIENETGTSILITGTVEVSNFPTTSTVYQGTIPWITNTTVTNWPALQYVNGTLYAVQSGTWNINVTSLPAVSGTVAVSSLPAITGTVVVSNFTSTVRVDNFPTSVTVTNFTSTVFVSNTLTFSNTSFAVTNFPTTSTVFQGTSPWITSGTVAISSMPEVEIKNDAGNPIPVAWTYGNGATLIPWEVQVARGLIPGVTGLSISGYRSSSGSGFLPAWEDGTYVYFTTAQVVRIWSASAADTNVSVRIDGLDADYVQQTETVVLTNGTTGTLTTKQFLRINSISLARAPNNVGLIHAGSDNKAITLAYIGTAANNSAGRSQMTVYTVPAGYTFYLTQSNWYQNANQPAAYRSWTQRPDGLINVVLTFPILDNYSSTKVVPRPYPEKTDIQWQASVSNNSSIGGQIEGYLISNAYL